MGGLCFHRLQNELQAGAICVGGMGIGLAENAKISQSSSPVAVRLHKCGCSLVKAHAYYKPSLPRFGTRCTKVGVSV